MGGEGKQKVREGKEMERGGGNGRQERASHITAALGLAKPRAGHVSKFAKAKS